MKALSLRQPWANAVIYLGKTIENRCWNTRFRGEFLIHAAKGMTREELADARSFSMDVIGAANWGHDIEQFFRDDRIHRGGIVGRARLVSVVPPCSSEPSLFWRPCEHPWHMPEKYGFVLEDVREVPFVPCKGALGFFDVPTSVRDELAKALPRSP